MLKFICRQAVNVSGDFENLNHRDTIPEVLEGIVKLSAHCL